MKTIAIITAMEIEAREVRANMVSTEEISSPFFGAWRGRIHDTTVVLVQSGAGKVCAAMATQWASDQMQLDAIFNVGIAGGLTEKTDINTVVLGTTFVQHDFMPAPWLGRRQGEVPFFGDASYPTPDPEIIQSVRRVMSGNPVIEGTILSGDEPIFDETRRQELLTVFAEFSPVAVDMESASFAFVAEQNNIPFAVIRTIADRTRSSDRPRVAGANAEANGSAALAGSIVARYCEQR